MLSVDNITLQGFASDQVYPSLVRLSLRVGKNSLSIMHLCHSIFSHFFHLSEVVVCFSVSWSISGFFLEMCFWGGGLLSWGEKM